jgi:hypothetical protein
MRQPVAPAAQKRPARISRSDPDYLAAVVTVGSNPFVLTHVQDQALACTRGMIGSCGMWEGV